MDLTMRLLVVEDERDLADATAEGLRREGYAVDIAYDGDEALVKARVYPYDLVCLDLGLPGTDGRQVARVLRVHQRWDGEPPPRILMLTARDALEDRVGGLDDGADDYLVKPVELVELAARVRALLRRRPSEAGAVLRVGDLELDAARHEARRQGRLLDLSPKEFALLHYLMAHRGEVLSESHLLTHVWDENANPYSKTVRVTLMNLRRKLAPPGAPQPIETIVGAGYRLRDEQ
jgi:DNA-binding response OmpR family regulator